MVRLTMIVVVVCVVVMLVTGFARRAEAAPSAGEDRASPGSVTALCSAIAKRLRSVPAEMCLSVELVDSGAVSVQGRPLLVVESARRPEALASAEESFRPPRVLLIGGIHGDELASVSVVFQWMPHIRGGGDGFHWRVIPLANPDGLLAKRPSRTNARGVDLNRNFSSEDWVRDALGYWKGRIRADPRRNPGQSPASEPETRWLEAQVAEFMPDVIVAVHAPYGVLDFDGPNEPPRRFGSLRLNRLGVYPGSLGNFAGVDRSIPVVTLELPLAGAMPTQAELTKIWNDMVGWIRRNVPARA